MRRYRSVSADSHVQAAAPFESDRIARLSGFRLTRVDLETAVVCLVCVLQKQLDVG